MAASQSIDDASFRAIGEIVRAMKADLSKTESGLEWLRTTKLTKKDYIDILNAATVFDPFTGQTSVEPSLVFDFVEGKALLVKPPTAQP
jgi:hypothetical protein